MLSILTSSIFVPVYKMLAIITYKLGRVSAMILLGNLFYLLFTPVALIYRLIGKDPLDREIEVDRETYWIPKEKSKVNKVRYEQQF